MSQKKALKLTLKQREVAERLARGESAIWVAKQCKVRRETISRWKAKPEFIAEMERVREAMFRNLREDFRLLAVKAMRTLHVSLEAYHYDPHRTKGALETLRMLGADHIASHSLTQLYPECHQSGQEISPEAAESPPGHSA